MASYLVQASVSSPLCQNAPHRSLARDEGHMLIQLRTGSLVLLQYSPLSASTYSSPLIRFLFTFFSFLYELTGWIRFCFTADLRAPAKTSFSHTDKLHLLVACVLFFSSQLSETHNIHKLCTLNSNWKCFINNKTSLRTAPEWKDEKNVCLFLLFCRCELSGKQGFVKWWG